MRQWIGSALVQIMACRLIGANHYLNQCWEIVNWTLKNKIHWNLNSNTNIFIHENAFENIVCEIAAILSKGRWVNSSSHHYDDVIMSTMASQITSLTVVYSPVYSDTDQRKHQSSASLAFVWGIHRDRWIPRTKGQLRGKCFHLMTSSCANHH